jgi:hypothetical protein
MFPLKDAGLRAEVTEMLRAYLRDTAKCRYLQPCGKYVRAFGRDSLRPSRNGHGFAVQNFFIEHPTPSAVEKMLARRAPALEALA